MLSGCASSAVDTCPAHGNHGVSRRIHGSSLDKVLKSPGLDTQRLCDVQQYKQMVVDTAAQMLQVRILASASLLLQTRSWLHVSMLVVQTMHLLHTDCAMAHLDITSSNVMLRFDECQSWDQLRLVDFGFAQRCDPGVTHCGSLYTTISLLFGSCSKPSSFQNVIPITSISQGPGKQYA